MKVLDNRLDDAPTENDIKELAELRIRNLQCFSELQSLNDTGAFINRHPILQNNLEYDTLLSLWKTDRDSFIRQYENCRNNIRRYQGRLKQTNVSDTVSDDAMNHLLRHQERAIIFKKILSNEPNYSNI